MFKEERTGSQFDWSMLGNLAEGRPNLGDSMNVAVYRLMQFTLRDVLIQRMGVAAADRVFYDAGREAGVQFYAHVLTKKDSFPDFVGDLQDALRKLNIGILRVEQADLERLRFTLTVAEDLDCSGLPVCGEQVCTYDEGFIHGLLSSHTGREFQVREVDCWASGDRVCRFEAHAL
ncbi:V4R domain-containing protein [uncultured Thiodictyon sp.]|jgi:predicted hydrocarbon binding protein|uniref:V4R domain-containing protein n=1 Tax=uncultured Thiodictyon sp. TaxID=1846217 RepID=UPI0025CBDD87|nr:V4R domain-containing protein [uncultured Thiodictyon sp.]